MGAILNQISSEPNHVRHPHRKPDSTGHHHQRSHTANSQVMGGRLSGTPNSVNVLREQTGRRNHKRITTAHHGGKQRSQEDAEQTGHNLGRNVLATSPYSRSANCLASNLFHRHTLFQVPGHRGDRRQAPRDRAQRLTRLPTIKPTRPSQFRLACRAHAHHVRLGDNARRGPANPSSR